ncbi:hypothetical protein FSARC_5989 [Fusarium sarcochroum]|uniref:Uncharacterized protein n=1 Tax=Fusarium sarcochroum TaxID=1208366 RepID=A0A8H4X8Y9_9HYPO|nr:hypothetical protein FSARC_5989 [Fusarium sarcochroum]
MDDRPVLPSERVAPLQSFLEQWTTQIHPIKSLEEAFQERYHGARALFNNALHPLESDSEAPSDQDTFSTRLDALLHYGKQIKELEAQHEAEKQNEEREYQGRLWRQQESLLFDLLDLFGPCLSDDLMKKWRGRAVVLPSTSTQLDTYPDRIDPHPTSQTTPPNPTSRPDLIRQSPITDQPAIRDPTNEPTPNPPNTGDTVEQGTSPNETQHDESEQAVSAAQQKRRASSPPIDSTHPEKRVRSDNLPDPLTEDRSIDFDQVFQNGNAEVRYVIAPFNERWYILECKEHGKHFMKSPIQGANKHLRSDAHGGLRLSHPETIGMLGTRVLNCNEERAEMNNRVARRSSYDQTGQPQSSMASNPTLGQSSNTHVTTHNGPHTRSSEAIPGIDPQPGEIYTTYWKETKTFYAVVILPWGTFYQFGWSISLKNTALLKNVPTCYIYDPEAGEEAVEWAPAYRPGAPSFAKRKYPVIYFDASEFPERCSVGWVAVSDLRQFDPHDKGLPHRSLVQDFIMSQRTNTQNNVEAAHNSASDQDSTNNLHTPPGDAVAPSGRQPNTHPDSNEAKRSGVGSSQLIVIPDDDSEPDERPITQSYQYPEKAESPQPSTSERHDHPVTEHDNPDRPQGAMEGDQYNSRTDQPNQPPGWNQQDEKSNTADDDFLTRTDGSIAPPSHSDLMGSAEYLEGLNTPRQPNTGHPNTNTLQQSDITSGYHLSTTVQTDETASVPRVSAPLNKGPANAQLEAYTKTIDETRVHFRFVPAEGCHSGSIGITTDRNSHADQLSQRPTTSHPANGSQPRTTSTSLPSSQHNASIASQAADTTSSERLQASQAPLMREANDHAELARDAMERYHWVNTLSPVKPTVPPGSMARRDGGVVEGAMGASNQGTPQRPLQPSATWSSETEGRGARGQGSSQSQPWREIRQAPHRKTIS